MLIGVTGLQAEEGQLSAGTAVSMPRRDIVFDIGEDAQRDWYEGDPLRSAYCDALSVFFPVGERFFIAAVRAYARRIDDPALKEEVRAFCVQEALHTREHEAYNDTLRGHGYDVEGMEARAARALDAAKWPLRRLEVTAAIEHLTATLAHLVLENPDVMARVPAPYRDLWTWHCLEEMEHKGVAFDVLQRVLADSPAWKRYLQRSVPLAVVTFELHRVLFTNIHEILRVRGFSTGFRHWGSVFWLLFGRPGWYRRVMGYYLRYYRPGFHPWEVGEPPDVQRWRDHFDSRLRGAS